MPSTTAGALGGHRRSQVIGHGLRHVEVNGKRNPSLEAVELSLRFGLVGPGSFEETGGIHRVRITGEERK